MSGLASAAAADLSLTGTNLTLVVVVAVIAVIALAMGVFFRRQVLAADPGTEKMQEIGAAVEEGAQAYLARQFKTLAVFVVLVFFLLLLLPAPDWGVKLGSLGLLHPRRVVLRLDRLPRHEPGGEGQRARGLGGPARRP